MKTILFSLVVVAALTSCNRGSDKTSKVTKQFVTENNQTSVSIGGIVPSYLVCMVNDEYMGKEQLEVTFKGKVYYGCCEMCKERIPNDMSVRTAIDPISKKEVDKSTAIIAITGGSGEITYFENKETYTNYINSLNY